MHYSMRNDFIAFDITVIEEKIIALNFFTQTGIPFIPYVAPFSAGRNSDVIKCLYLIG